MEIDSRPQIKVDDELRKICKEIVREGKTSEEWSLIESDDMFQTPRYDGGFNATEQEFWFSYTDPEGKEWWLGFALEVANKITTTNDYYLDLYEPS